MKTAVATLFAAVLAGCHPAASYDISSSGYRIPPGSSLTVNKELPIPSGQRHVKLQHGQPVAGVDEFKMNCQLWVYDLGVSYSTSEGKSVSSTRATLRQLSHPRPRPLSLRLRSSPGWGGDRRAGTQCSPRDSA